MTTYITTARFEFEDGSTMNAQWENECLLKWPALMQKAKEIGAARFDLTGATHIEKQESPCAPTITDQSPFRDAIMADQRLSQALAILDALDRLVTPTHALHLARDSHGRYIVRYDAEDALLAPERHTGASTRDALAQLVQSHPEGV